MKFKTLNESSSLKYIPCATINGKWVKKGPTFDDEDDAIQYAIDNNIECVIESDYKHKLKTEVFNLDDYKQYDINHPIYDQVDDLLNNLNESLSDNDKIKKAVKLLYLMDTYVLDVYDNELWLMDGVPDGEFEEKTVEEVVKNYKDHAWLVTDSTEEKFDEGKFKEFIETFKAATKDKDDYDDLETKNKIEFDSSSLLLKENIENDKMELDELLNFDLPIDITANGNNVPFLNGITQENLDKDNIEETLDFNVPIKITANNNNVPFLNGINKDNK